MVTCRYCASSLPDTARFCGICGTIVHKSDNISPTDSALPLTWRSATPIRPVRGHKQESRESIYVFISYARRDRNLCDQLENHLSNLKYRGLITTWNAREIRAGEEIVQQIDIHLNAAHIILLLISANFLASAYCYSQEMMRALQRGLMYPMCRS